MTDSIQPPPERARQGERIVPATEQIADVAGDIGAPYRLMLRSLARLHKQGTITDEERAAGLRFHQDWLESQGSAVSALDYSADRIDGGNGGFPGIVKGCLMLEAGKRAYAAVHCLPGFLHMRCAELVLGKAVTLKEFARVESIGHRRASNLTRETLAILALHYQGLDGDRES